MPLQMQSGGLLPGQDNNLLPQARHKSVSFQTPADATKKSKTTGRRAFGDISNRKQSNQSAQQNTGLHKPTNNNNKPSVRVERQPASVKKPQASTNVRSSQNPKEDVYESIELPYGPTGRELDEMYDSDGHVSVCSMEKEGYVFSRQETASMIRRAMNERRKEEQNYSQALWENVHAENLALLHQDGTCACACLLLSIVGVW